MKIRTKHFKAWQQLVKNSLENVSNLAFRLGGHFGCQKILQKYNTALIRL